MANFQSDTPLYECEKKKMRNKIKENYRFCYCRHLRCCRCGRHHSRCHRSWICTQSFCILFFWCFVLIFVLFYFHLFVCIAACRPVQLFLNAIFISTIKIFCWAYGDGNTLTLDQTAKEWKSAREIGDNMQRHECFNWFFYNLKRRRQKKRNEWA